MATRHCKQCRKKTEHDVKKQTEGVARLALGIFTAGASELMNETYFVCQRCGRKTQYDALGNLVEIS